MPATPPSSSETRAPGALRAGGLVAVAASLVGVGLALSLTVLKFKFDHLPCIAEGNSCGVTPGMTCDDALHSPFSVAFGLPLSIWAAAFYGVSVVIGLGLASRPRGFLGGLAPLVLLVLAALDVLVTVYMAAVAMPTLDAACPSCLGLYGVSAVLLVAALIARTAPPSDGWRGLLGRRPASRVDAAFLVVTLMIGLVGAQAVAYQVMRGRVDSDEGCPEIPPVAAIPPASVIFGAAEPDVVAAYFLDPTCSACRDEFREITAAIRERSLPRAVQLRIYHYPRVAGGCWPEDYRGDEPSSAIATENDACIGSLAIECVELLDPGMGIRMVGEILDLQRTGTPMFTSDKLARAARRLGLEIDPSDPQNALFHCIAKNKEIQQRVRAHIRFAVKHGPGDTPHGYFIAVDDGRLSPERVETFRGRLSAQIRDRKIDSVAREAAEEVK